MNNAQTVLAMVPGIDHKSLIQVLLVLLASDAIFLLTSSGTSLLEAPLLYSFDACLNA